MMLIREALDKIDEAESIIGQQPTNPTEVGRSGSPTCQVLDRLQKASQWLDQLDENL
jgi:hypothetical protein